jgi:transcriptional regulator with XRE-family HTH domain
MDNQVRGNLREAIAQSGFVIKEIAAKSGIKKATIDNWVGISPTTPRAPDLVPVARILGVTVEWLVDGTGPQFWYPKKIEDIVEDLKIIDDENALDSVRAVAHTFAERVRARSRDTGGG